MNGYSGFIPEPVFELEKTMTGLIEVGDVEDLHAYLEKLGVDYFVLNSSRVSKELRTPAQDLEIKLLSSPLFTPTSPNLYKVE